MNQNTKKLLTSCGVFFVVFIILWQICILKVAPCFNADDSPETTVAFSTLGIQHPPGYPLNTLVGKIFTLIPVGDVMFRSNLMSMFFLFAACIFLFFFLKKNINFGRNKEFEDYFFAFLAVVFFISGHTTFFQATFAKGSIYSMNAFFVTAILFFAAGKGNNIKNFYITLFLYGLSLGNHWQSMTVLFPAFLIYLFWGAKKLPNGALFTGLVFFFFGASIYIFAAIRSNTAPVYAWGHIKNVDDFIWLVSRSQYAGAEGRHSFSDTINLLRYYFTEFIGREYPLFVAALSVPGIYFLLKNSKRECMVFLTAYLSIIVSIFIFATPPESMTWLIKPYLVSSNIFLSVFMAAGICFFIRMATNIKRIFAYPIIVVFILTIFCIEAPNNSHYMIGYDYSENIIKSMHENSIIFVEQDMNIGSVLYQSFIKKEKIIPVIPSVLGSKWYGEQLKRNFGSFLSFPELGRDVGADITGIINANPSKDSYYSIVYSKQWRNFPVRQKGIVYEIKNNGKVGLAADEEIFKLYSFRGLLDDKIEYDEFTKSYAVENYGISFFNMGDSYMNAGQYDEALRYYKKGIIFLKNEGVFINMGSIYYRKNSFSEAEECWQEAIKLDNKSVYAYANLALLHFNRNDKEKAYEYVQKALILDGNNATAMQVKGMLENQMK